QRVARPDRAAIERTQGDAPGGENAGRDVRRAFRRGDGSRRRCGHELPAQQPPDACRAALLQRGWVSMVRGPIAARLADSLPGLTGQARLIRPMITSNTIAPIIA